VPSIKLATLPASLLGRLPCAIPLPASLNCSVTDCPYRPAWDGGDGWGEFPGVSTLAWAPAVGGGNWGGRGSFSKIGLTVVLKDRA
jgi:hypothetical protein